MNRSVHLSNRSSLFGRLVPAFLADRSGVALILVIGLLALMVVMGVTFSIFMRTERVAAGSFRNDVVARQLLHAALNTALREIDSDLQGKAYPSWYCLESGPPSGVPVTGVTNAPAMDWIPRAALGPNLNPQPRWIDPPAAGVPLEGRIAYLVVNCSGLLDVNFSGTNGVSRGIGTNVNEIQLASCSEVANVAQLVADRPYETIQELGKVGQASGALSQPVADFVCFSSFPTSCVGGTNQVLVDLSGDANALMARKASIIDGLTASGVDPGQASFVFSNLLDYVDADNLPRNLGSACTESVPMFNEIQVTNSYHFLANTNFTMDGKVLIEWFYPFVKPSSSRYWVEWNVSFEATPASFPVPPPISAGDDSGYAPGMSFPATPVSVPFRLTTRSYAAFIGTNVSLKVRISLQMHDTDVSGPVVDASPYLTNVTLTIPLVRVPVPQVSNVGRVVDAECTDPRFNWDTAQWRGTPNSVGTLGAMNRTALDFLNNGNTDGHADIFVADRPLKSVTELTYLLRGGKPADADLPLDKWNTIRLYDSTFVDMSTGEPVPVPRPLDRVLDHFVIPPTGYGKGLVNPNSGMTGVLAAVFRNMPVNRYPEESLPALPPLNPVEAQAIAAFWADASRNTWRCNFANLSDIGHATNVFGTAPLTGLSAFEQESFFRNSAGLFNTRQQYFIILLFAQVTRTVPQLADKSVLAGLRGVAEVWRDPLPNDDGTHPRFIRMFKILDNE